MTEKTNAALKAGVYFLIFFLLHACTPEKQYPTSGKVHIEKNGDKFTLIRNGEPFEIKGVAGFTYLQELRRCGGNTIRTWDTTNLAAILDSANRHQIAVVVGLPLYNSNHIHHYYEDSAQMQRLYRAMESTVNRYKGHPAVLMWCLGNELNYFYKPEDAFFKAYNDLLAMIHREDPDHPVTTALLNFAKKSIYNVQNKVPALDIVSINTYGRLSTLKNDLDNINWYWDGPFILGEWGINGYWESERTAWGAPVEDTSTKKAEQYQMIYQSRMPYQNPRYLGSFVFYWGYQHEKTPTWFSLFSDDGAASASVETLSLLWGGKAFQHHAPQVEYTLLDGKGARENIVLTSSSIHQAQILLRDSTDSLRFRWEIRAEDWYKEKEDDPNKNKIAPPPIDSLVHSPYGSRVSFTAPKEEGPYRIYAWVYDRHGNFASSNTPFYVVKK